MSGIGPFKLLDLALIAIVALSGLVAMYRGFTREVLSILSWAMAAIAALYVIFYQPSWADQLALLFAAPPQRVHVIIAQVAIGSGIFLAVLIIVHLITSHISDTVLDSRIGVIDRILGLAFGMARGFVLVLIPYMFAVSFVCKDATQAIREGCEPGKLPPWVEEAQSKGILKRTGSTLFGVLHRFVPPGVSSG